MDTCFRYNYAEECKKDRSFMEQITYFDRLSPSNADFKSIDTHLPCISLETHVSALSKDSSDWLHAVEADRKGDHISIRVITKDNRGVNVILPNAKDRILYNKYRDLRFLIRNNDYILVTFPKLYVMPLKNVCGLYLLAHDFKVFNLDYYSQSDNKQNNSNLNNTANSISKIPIVEI